MIWLQLFLCRLASKTEVGLILEKILSFSKYTHSPLTAHGNMENGGLVIARLWYNVIQFNLHPTWLS